MSKIAIAMYHYVKNPATNKLKKIKGLTLSQFNEQIEYLRNNFNFISFKELIGITKGEVTTPENSVLLTFDDGYIDHYENVFPLLKAKSIPAFFSMPGKIIAEKQMLDVNKIHILLAVSDVPNVLASLFEKLDYYRGTEFTYPKNEELYKKLAQNGRFDEPDVVFIKRLLQVELPEQLRNILADELLREQGYAPESMVDSFYLSRQQVNEMHEAGMEWGIHGYDHYWMNRLEKDDLIKDIRAALDVFSEVIPPDGWGCCYPYGSVDEHVKKIVSDMGAVVGFSTHVDYAKLPSDDPLALPRFDTNDFPPISMKYLEFD